MSKFYTVSQLNNAAKRVTTASEMLKKVLVSIAYQGVMHGQVDILSKLAFFEEVTGYKGAQSKIKKWLKITPQILKEKKLSEEAKELFTELRKSWDDLSEDAIYAEIMVRAFPPANKDKEEVSVHTKVMKYLDKIDTATFTDGQKDAMNELLRQLALGKAEKNGEVGEDGKFEPNH